MGGIEEMNKYKKGRKEGITEDELKSMLEDAAEKGAKKALEEEAKARKDGEEDPAASLVEEIVAEAVEEVAATKRRKARKSEDGEAEVSPEEIESIVEAVIEDTKRRKSKKEDTTEDEQKSLDALDDETVIDSILEAVTEGALVDDEKGEDDDGEEKDDEEKDDDEEKGRRKSRTSVMARKAKNMARKARGQTRAAQSKYSNVFMQKGSDGVKEEKKIPPALQLARAVKCFDVFGRQDPERAAYYAKAKYGDDAMAREFKALSATSPTAGGYLIPEVYVDQVIELLYPKTVMFELGAQKVPMPNGNLNLPKMTAGARATWGGEQRRIAKTQPEYGNIKLSAKRLGAIVPQSRELMMLSSISADQMFANDLTRKMQLGLDYGGLLGKGGEYEPTGIANNKDVEKVDVTKITDPDLVAAGKITADFPVFLRSKILQKNVDDVAMGWAFNSILEGYLMNLKTTTGTYIYREEMNAGKLLGFPYKICNQIAYDTGKTSLFLGNWNDLLVGETAGLETYTTLDGAWIDEDGVQHNAFDENLAATRALLYVDIAARHGESFLYVHDIKV